MPVTSSSPSGAGLVYLPGVVGIAAVYFSDTRRGVEHREELSLMAELSERSGADWRDAEPVTVGEDDLTDDPEAGAAFGDLTAGWLKKGSPRAWERELVDVLYRTRRLQLLKSPSLKELSRPGESEGDFRIRLADAFRDARDEAVEELREKYATKVARMEERIRKAELAVEREREQVRQQKMQAAISVGATLLTSFLGRKRVSRSTLGRATTAARGYGRASKEQQDVARAEENLEALMEGLAELQREFEAEVDELSQRLDHRAEELETVTIKPLKRDVEVRMVALGWRPFWEVGRGRREPAGP
jgi:hypothetical protein